MYEFFEHTADLGLRVRAPTLDELFVEAARALFAAILDDPSQAAPREAISVRLEETDRELLLFDWLNMLLFRFETEHRVFGRFEAHVADGRLEATAWGEMLDPARHALNHEVKAITYHGLRVEPDADGWLAEFIVDI